MLNSIKLLKRYFTATLDNFSNKKKLDDNNSQMMTKKILLDTFFKLQQNFTT